MIVAIHQPLYLPYYGFFQKAAQADTFVFLDNVQYSNNNWQDYNTIKTPQGTMRLRVPVEVRFGQKICEARPRDELRWAAKHKKVIEMNYRRAKHFEEVSSSIFGIIGSPHSSLAELNVALCREFIRRMGLKTNLVLASSLQVSGKKEGLVIDICKELKATEYLSGRGAAAYQQGDHFTENGIELTYLEPKEPSYKQLWGTPAAGLSFLDYFMNSGFRRPVEWE